MYRKVGAEKVRSKNSGEDDGKVKVLILNGNPQAEYQEFDVYLEFCWKAS